MATTVKPEDWLGSGEDQQELFVEILANLTGNELSDRNHHRPLTFELFSEQLPSLLFEEKFYDLAEKYFHKFLAAWCVVYNSRTGITDRQLVNGSLKRDLYATYFISLDGKAKKYVGVYEDLARDR